MIDQSYPHYYLEEGDEAIMVDKEGYKIASESAGFPAKIIKFNPKVEELPSMFSGVDKNQRRISGFIARNPEEEKRYLSEFRSRITRALEIGPGDTNQAFIPRSQ